MRGAVGRASGGPLASRSGGRTTIEEGHPTRRLRPHTFLLRVTGQGNGGRGEGLAISRVGAGCQAVALGAHADRLVGPRLQAWCVGHDVQSACNRSGEAQNALLLECFLPLDKPSRAPPIINMVPYLQLVHDGVVPVGVGVALTELLLSGEVLSNGSSCHTRLCSQIVKLGHFLLPLLLSPQDEAGAISVES